MAAGKQRAKTAAEAVRIAIAREEEARSGDLKPIEILKIALCAYQSYLYKTEPGVKRPERGRRGSLTNVESEDSKGYRRGTQSAFDRTLFNVNYWLSAYENRIVAACADPDDAERLLTAISAWNSHTMRLNTLSDEQVRETFERFCPPISENNRRGGSGRAGRGKGPVPDFLEAAHEVASRRGGVVARRLKAVAADVTAEAEVYRRFSDASALDTFYDLLPVWCLQDRIGLVRGTWWDDVDVMSVIARCTHERFLKTGEPVSLCKYYLDSVNEALDAYSKVAASPDERWRGQGVGELLERVQSERQGLDDFEVDGYTDALPAWLLPKEQLIWNILVCAVYGPGRARPFLPAAASTLLEGSPDKLDVITDMARSAYGSYLLMRKEQGESPEFLSFENQPEDLRASMLAQVESFHDKLAVLGYHIVPAASCYPEQRVDVLTPSEVECLAVLEHRRWMGEREQAGWTFGENKDVAAKRSPYLVAWEDLPEQARERNRRAVNNIPALLASVGLAISR